ncbi:hypothetical protein HNQ91_002090 [Filimonas zeae]|uniref:Peptidase S74 domain-containing protein n=1 Tax=Filimonas zeae TaxID=1737353 RepID=A0A917IV19_9BACT|nr:TMF family protein [Filimonas zeae]MDR6339039.1 hypothetical protein [Filimonas zeae]GGH65396.1 hypothetical protein GCM10011379_18480 [Filimonas zeae]
MKKIVLLLTVIFAMALSGSAQFTTTNLDYFTTVTFPGGYAIGDYVEFVKANPMSAWASGNYEISITYTRGNMAAAATFRASLSHSNPAVWREAGKVNSNKYLGTSANFTIDCNTEYTNPRFRIRAIGTGGVLTDAQVVYIRVRSVNHNLAWTTLNVTGNDVTINKFSPMTDEWSLYVGTPYSIAGANLAISAIANGNVGLGTATPAYKLDVNGTAYVSGSTISAGQVTAMNGTRLKATSGNGVQITGAAGIGIRGVGTNTTAGYAAIQTAYDNVNFLCPLTLQDQGGNVLIGKTTQTNANYKLDVNGIIRANKLVVNTTGADFVFEKGYHLPSLDSVEQYVKANQHLPGITPAAEMQKEGVEVGEQQTKLLQKIEELTLYIIEQNKKIEKQGAQLQQQGEEIKQLKAKLK